MNVNVNFNVRSLNTVPILGSNISMLFKISHKLIASNVEELANKKFVNTILSFVLDSPFIRISPYFIKNLKSDANSNQV